MVSKCAMRFPFLRSLTLALSGFALVAASPAVKAPAKPKAAATKVAPVEADVPWLYKNSDIPVDKQWIFGELPNGLRYAVRRNRAAARSTSAGEYTCPTGSPAISNTRASRIRAWPCTAKGPKRSRGPGLIATSADRVADP